MSESKSTVYLAPPFFLLFLTFLVLKLTGVITWSWWWVTAPLWGGFALVVSIFLAVALIALLAGIIAGIVSYFNR